MIADNKFKKTESQNNLINEFNDLTSQQILANKIYKKNLAEYTHKVMQD